MEHVILEESPTFEADPAFFGVFAQFVRESALTHAEITRRINEKSKFHALYLGRKKARDPRPRYEAFHQSTLTNIVKGKDLPTTLTLYRIARLGLELSEEQCAWLEFLRLDEEYINHSTTHAPVVAPPKMALNQEDEIAWITEKERAGIGD